MQTLADIHHVDTYSSNSDQQVWATGVVDCARSKGVPVWNADQWLSFTQTRHDATYNTTAWNAGSGVLSFTITMTATPSLTPTTVLPLSYAGQPLQSVTVDSTTYTFTAQTIKSTNAAFVSPPAGNHSVTATYEKPTAMSLRTFTAHSYRAVWLPSEMAMTPATKYMPNQIWILSRLALNSGHGKSVSFS